MEQRMAPPRASRGRQTDQVDDNLSRRLVSLRREIDTVLAKWRRDRDAMERLSTREHNPD